ncbi:MAG: hypothetical protein JSU74_00055 [Candidatus Zixiibacteriota bacterium]|nr:MAG: hypothetical protein JSU74_00055 [candidate division Zixibacteria bacterium]
MSKSSDRDSYLSRFRAPAGCEKDLTFRAAVLRLSGNSMLAVGLLGLIIPLTYILIQLLVVGRPISSGYEQTGLSSALLLWDKGLIMLLGLISLVLSQTRVGPKWGRLIIAAIIVSASIATLSDDIARGDLSLSAGWLALMMFVSLTVPYRPWQTLLLGAVIIGSFLLTVEFLPKLTGWQAVILRPESLIFLILVVLVCAGISALLYASLYRQHQARLALAATNRRLRETQAQLVQSAKMASLGNMVAGVAHEINNPLGVIHSNAGLIKRAVEKVRHALDAGAGSAASESGNELNKSLGLVSDMNAVTMEASARIDSVVRALRNFASLDEAELQQVDLRDEIESVLAIFPQYPGKDIRISREFAQLPPVTCYPGQFNQVIMNLLQNSAEAISGQGTITVRTCRDDNWVVVQIIDTGRGIPESEQQHVFDPGYTTKGAGVGTGLGLPICYRIMESHNGRIELASQPKQGTVITLRLPVDQ